jgi:hypothetical protein
MLSILRKDVFVLGLTDAVMFGATFLCVVLQKAVYHRWINWNSWGWIIQHVLSPPPSSPVVVLGTYNRYGRVRFSLESSDGLFSVNGNGLKRSLSSFIV